MLSPVGSRATLIAEVSVKPRREPCYTDSGSECLSPVGSRATLIAEVSVKPRREPCYTDSGSEC